MDRRGRWRGLKQQCRDGNFCIDCLNSLQNKIKSFSIYSLIAYNSLIRFLEEADIVVLLYPPLKLESRRRARVVYTNSHYPISDGRHEDGMICRDYLRS